MKKWIRNIAIGMALNSIKNSKFGKGILAKLKSKSTLIGRIGIVLFTGLGALKYYYPELPIDESAEILGIIFSWLALELGFENIKKEELLKFDPNNPVNIDLGDFAVTLPAFEKTVTTDETGEAESIEENQSDGEEK